MSMLRPAATVLLIRPGSEGAFQVYLVQRHPRAGFFGGAFVFPGGAVDAEDCAPDVLATIPEATQRRCARLMATSPSQAVGLFVAACREVFEEAGVLLAAPRAQGAWPRADELAAGREALHQGRATFAELLGRWQVQLTLEELWPWAHWITPSVEPKRFDTRFLVARMPAHQQASIDAREAVDCRWLSPAAALAAYQSGDIVLPPPTFRILEELDAFLQAADGADFGALVEALERRVVLPIQPKIGQYQGDMAILLPWDRAYGDTAGDALTPEPAYPDAWRHGPSRIVLRKGRWRSEP